MSDDEIEFLKHALIQIEQSGYISSVEGIKVIALLIRAEIRRGGHEL